MQSRRRRAAVLRWISLGRIQAEAGSTIEVNVTAGDTGITRADAVRLYAGD